MDRIDQILLPPVWKTCFSILGWIWHAKNDMVIVQKFWELGWPPPRILGKNLKKYRFFWNSHLIWILCEGFHVKGSFVLLTRLTSKIFMNWALCNEAIQNLKGWLAIATLKPIFTFLGRDFAKKNYWIWQNPYQEKWKLVSELRWLASPLQ